MTPRCPGRRGKLVHPTDEAAQIILEVECAIGTQQAGLSEMAEVVEMSGV